MIPRGDRFQRRETAEILSPEQLISHLQDRLQSPDGARQLAEILFRLSEASTRDAHGILTILGLTEELEAAPTEYDTYEGWRARGFIVPRGAYASNRQKGTGKALFSRDQVLQETRREV